MVTRNHTRRRARVPHPSRRPVSADQSTRNGIIRELEEVKARLAVVCSAVTVAIGVLESQAADFDLDVASTLRTSVRDALAQPIARLEAVLRELERGQAVAAAAPAPSAGASQ